MTVATLALTRLRNGRSLGNGIKDCIDPGGTAGAIGSISSGSTGEIRRLQLRFSLTSIPVGSVVVAVDIILAGGGTISGSGTYYPCQYTGAADLSDAAGTVYDKSAGTVYGSAVSQITSFSPLPLNAAGIAAVQAALGAQDFAIAIRGSSESFTNGPWIQANNHQLSITYTTPPNPPTIVYPEKDKVVIDARPAFIGQYTHPDSTAGNRYQVQVLADDGTTVRDDSGGVAFTLAQNALFYYTVPATLSGGGTLTPGTYYRYKMRTSTDAGAHWSNYSDPTLTRFRIDQGPAAPTSLVPTGGAGTSPTPTLTWDFTHPQSPNNPPYYDAMLEIALNASPFTVVHTKYTIPIYDDFSGTWPTPIKGAANWVSQKGTFSIAGAVLKAATMVTDLSDPVARAIATLDVGLDSADIEGRVTLSTVAGEGIGVIWMTDASNYWRFVLFGQNRTWKLEKVVATVITTVANGTIPSTLSGLHEIKFSTKMPLVYIDRYKVITPDINDSFTPGTLVGVYFCGSVGTASFTNFRGNMKGAAHVASESVLAYTVPSAVLTAGTTYKWRVKTRDEYLWSAFSNYAVFTPSTPNTVTITAPTEAQVLAAPTPTIQWTASGGNTPTRYRVLVYAADGVTVVFDSGWLSGNPLTYNIPAGYLFNSTAYKMTVSVQDAGGIEGVSALRTISTVWTAPAAITGPLSQGDDTLAIVLLTWDQSTDTNFLAYDIYESSGGAGNRIARIEAITQNSLTYLLPLLNLNQTYSIRQVASFGGEELPSAATDFPVFKVVNWFLLLSSVASQTQPIQVALGYDPQRTVHRVQDLKDVQYWGRDKPVRHFGTQDYTTLDLQFTLPDITVGDVETLLEGKDIICVRDPRGRKYFGYLNPYDAVDTLPASIELSFRFVETEYSET